MFSSFSLHRYHGRLKAMALLTLMMLATIGHATDYYLTFNDGHLLVFPGNSIKDITTVNDQVTIVAVDGQTFTYSTLNLKAIDHELTKELPAITSYKFSKSCNHQVLNEAVGTIGDDEINIEVLGIGKWLTPTYELSDEHAVAFVNGRVQQSTMSRLHFNTGKTYVISAPGDQVLTVNAHGQCEFEPYGRRYMVHVDFSTDHSNTVPRIDINTAGGADIASRDVYLDAEIIIDGKGIFPSMTDSVHVKGRGHNSWSSNPDAKNPYRLKFDSKKRPLGLKAGKSWVLLANKINGAMLSNAIGMKAAALIGTPAANHIIPVDLFVNGVYKGSYNFTEKVGMSNNSINLDDDTYATLLNLDINIDGPPIQRFSSKPYSIHCNIKHPDFDEDETYINKYNIWARFNAMCQAVEDSAGIADHLDMDYLARYLMFNELVCNYEIFHPKSTYCYNENIYSDSCKFIFGPAWDFDWAFGYQTNHNYFRCSSRVDYFNIYNWGQSPFFKRLRHLPEVIRRMHEMWQEFVDNDLDELCDFCEEYYLYAKPSLERNASATCTNDTEDYEAQWQRAAQWLRNRANKLLERTHDEMLLPGDCDGDGIVNIQDVTVLINFLLTGDSQGIDPANTDVNGDGDINIGDVTDLISKLLGTA